MRKLLRRMILPAVLFFSLKAYSQNLIQATLKMGDASNKVDVWLKPNFDNNNVHYLFQIGIPIAWPTMASPQPSNFTVLLDPSFISNFGNNSPTNYTVNKYQTSTSTNGLDKYITIALVRTTSNPQNWKKDTEFKVLTIVFDNPVGSPGTQVKIADYQDGGSDGQGNFYTQDESNNYYVVPTSNLNFYGSGTESTVGGSSSAGFVQTSSTIPVAVCNAPSTPIVSNITTTSASISWDPPVNGAVGYEYQISTNSNAVGSGISTSVTSYSPNSLDPATLYYVHIRTYCGTSSYSPWVTKSFNTQVPSCTAPTGVLINNISNTGATIKWDEVGGIINYEYIISTDPIATGSGTTINTNTAIINGLSPGTTYYLHVRSNCGGGLFSSWTSVSFEIPCPSPAIPQISGVSTSGANLNWPVISGASGYEYIISSSLTPTAPGVNITNNYINLSGLITGTQYYFHIRTGCASGSFSAWVTLPFTTLCPSPPSPIVSNINPTNATIYWDAVQNAESYQYLISTSQTPQGTGIATIFTSTIANNLIQGTQYYVHVRTQCSPGVYSTWTTTPFVTPFPPCNAPIISPITNAKSSVQINWSLVSGGLGYEYLVSTNPTPQGSGTLILLNNVIATDLLSNTQYYFHVRTNCGAGRYSNWITQPFKTICFKPTPFVFNNQLSAGSVDLVWNKILGAESYEYTVTEYRMPPIASLAETSDTILHLGNLKQGAKYYFQIRTHCGSANLSEWSLLEFNVTGINASFISASHIINLSVFGTKIQDELVAIFDISGKLVKKVRMFSNSINIDMSGFASGIYLIRLGKSPEFQTKILVN